LKLEAPREAAGKFPEIKAVQKLAVVEPLDAERGASSSAKVQPMSSGSGGS
jgi:hypothetical protein